MKATENMLGDMAGGLMPIRITSAKNLAAGSRNSAWMPDLPALTGMAARGREVAVFVIIMPLIHLIVNPLRVLQSSLRKE